MNERYGYLANDRIYKYPYMAECDTEHVRIIPIKKKHRYHGRTMNEIKNCHEIMEELHELTSNHYSPKEDDDIEYLENLKRHIDIWIDKKKRDRTVDDG